MLNIVVVLQRSIAEGIAGTDYKDSILGYQSEAFQSKIKAG